MKKLSSLSIFFPSLNDAKMLPYLIYKTYEIAPKVARSFEVIIINDGSDDDTKEVLDTLKKKYKNLVPIHHRKNTGYGGALTAGFRHARKEWIFYTDGDGQYDPSDLILLAKQANSRTDVVNGYKLRRIDNKARQAIGWAYNKLLREVYRVPISDVDCDFRLIRGSVLRKINLTCHSGMICLELILKLHDVGARFSEVGVSHYSRRFGRSQFFRPKHLFKTLTEHLVFYKSRKLAKT